MAGLTEVQTLYQTYLEEVERVEQERRPGEGLFGIGNKPSDDPCHERFAAGLETLLKDFEAQEPDSAQACAVLRYIYRAQLVNREPISAYWMLNAVHGLTLSLIGRLNAEDAAALREQYASDIPRREMLPVQKQVFSKLKQSMR